MFTTKLPVEIIETAYNMGSYGTISVTKRAFSVRFNRETGS